MFYKLLMVFFYSIPFKQVRGSSLYITDDTNTAMFPIPSGLFCTISLHNCSPYEVHGDLDQSELPASRALPTAGVPFFFMHRSSPSTETLRPLPGNPRAARSLFQARSFQRLFYKTYNYITNNILKQKLLISF